MEVGFEAAWGAACARPPPAESGRAAAADAAAGALRAAADALDALADRQRLLDAHAAPSRCRARCPTRAPRRPRRTPSCATCWRTRARTRPTRWSTSWRRAWRSWTPARASCAECHENAKTLDAAEAELVKQMEGGDAQWDVSALFGPGAAAAPPGAPPPPDDLEDYYLAKFRAYAASAARLARLDAKALAARRLARRAPPPPAPASPPRRLARLRRGQFAAPLELRLPVVLTSCVRVIARYGLRHQGVFRVSGSQVEMQALRAAFERGEDPLAGVRDASDINTVCGLLKLYLREVRPPLLPPQLQERLLRVAALPDDAAFVRRMRDTLAALPPPALIVLRYLFAFLAHLAEHSAENMMDAWNLAICLGPTLLAAWGEGGAQVAAQNLVNELVKRCILHHAQLFPQDLAPDALYSRASRLNSAPKRSTVYVRLLARQNNRVNELVKRCICTTAAVPKAGPRAPTRFLLARQVRCCVRVRSCLRAETSQRSSVALHLHHAQLYPQELAPDALYSYSAPSSVYVCALIARRTSSTSSASAAICTAQLSSSRTRARRALLAAPESALSVLDVAPDALYSRASTCVRGALLARRSCHELVKRCILHHAQLFPAGSRPTPLLARQNFVNELVKRLHPAPRATVLGRTLARRALLARQYVCTCALCSRARLVTSSSSAASCTQRSCSDTLAGTVGRGSVPRRIVLPGFSGMVTVNRLSVRESLADPASRRAPCARWRRARGPDDVRVPRRRAMRDTLAAAAARATLLRYLVPPAPVQLSRHTHLAEHSAREHDGRVEPAICLGPTLLAAWARAARRSRAEPRQRARQALHPAHAQLSRRTSRPTRSTRAPGTCVRGRSARAQNLVNELVKRCILHHAQLFPQDLAPDALYSRARTSFNELVKRCILHHAQLFPQDLAPTRSTARQNLVNELVKRCILHHAQLFPQDLAPDALYSRARYVCTCALCSRAEPRQRARQALHPAPRAAVPQDLAPDALYSRASTCVRVRSARAQNLRQRAVKRCILHHAQLFPQDLGPTRSTRAPGTCVRVRSCSRENLVNELVKRCILHHAQLSAGPRARRALLARQVRVYVCALLARRTSSTSFVKRCILHHAQLFPQDLAPDALYSRARYNLVNELVKRCILHHAQLFPQDLAPDALYSRASTCVRVRSARAQNLVNELVKRCILHHAQLFPQDLAPDALYSRARTSSTSSSSAASCTRAAVPADLAPDALYSRARYVCTCVRSRCAQNLVNELVKRCILHHAQLFPQDLAPDALYSRARYNLVNELVKRCILHHAQLFPQDLAPDALYSRARYNLVNELVKRCILHHAQLFRRTSRPTRSTRAPGTCVRVRSARAQNLVNELVKRCILHHAQLFPQDLAPDALYSRARYNLVNELVKRCILHHAQLFPAGPPPDALYSRARYVCTCALCSRAEPRQRARQALHPAPRAAVPAGPRARRALLARQVRVYVCASARAQNLVNELVKRCILHHAQLFRRTSRPTRSTRAPGTCVRVRSARAQNLVNELVKRCILHHAQLFPQDLAPDRALLARQNLVNELVKRCILHHAQLFPQDLAPDALYSRARYNLVNELVKRCILHHAQLFRTAPAGTLGVDYYMITDSHYNYTTEHRKHDAPMTRSVPRRIVLSGFSGMSLADPPHVTSPAADEPDPPDDLSLYDIDDDTGISFAKFEDGPQITRVSDSDGDSEWAARAPHAP
uniref:Rho-GAP domain-containing protein n=1 Tax=Heliothis virescens TaxID=7102 RepID=A0A2A4K1X1_HELVI